MSQTFEVEWANGKCEKIELGGLRRMQLLWQPLASELGLKHLSMCDSFVVVDPCEIDLFALEVGIFGSEFTRRYPNDDETPQLIKRLQELVEKLRRNSGWTASIG